MKLNRLFAFWAIVIALFVCFQTPAKAATVTQFNDKATFLTATSATNATGPLPDTGAITPGNRFTIGNLTFSSPNVFAMGPSYGPAPNGDWTPLIPGNEISLNGTEDLNVDLKAPVYAFGFDFVETTDPVACNAPCIDSTFKVTLKNGTETVNTFQFNAKDDTAAFVGVWTDVPFNRIEIREIGDSIENDFYGQFYTGEIASQICRRFVK